jgi:hypothetical protein
MNLLGVFHPGPSLCKAASRLSLRWLGQGAEWLTQRELSILYGEGAHDSIPHYSTHDQAEQRPVAHHLLGLAYF